jgi:hypothetical protein
MWQAAGKTGGAPKACLVLEVRPLAMTMSLCLIAEIHFSICKHNKLNIFESTALAHLALRGLWRVDTPVTSFLLSRRQSSSN